MAKPLWWIPDPEEARRIAEAKREAELLKKETDRKDRAARAAGRRRERALIEQRLTEQRLLEAREWRATHKPPSKEELDALAAEFPNLAGVLLKAKR